MNAQNNILAIKHNPRFGQYGFIIIAFSRYGSTVAP